MQGFEDVFRTARREAAAPQRPEQERLGRRNHPAIQAHAEDEDMLGCFHSTGVLTDFNNRAFRSVVKKSRSTSAKPFPAIEGRPTRSEEHTSELQSLRHLVCRLLLEKK